MSLLEIYPKKIGDSNDLWIDVLIAVICNTEWKKISLTAEKDLNGYP